MKVQNGFSLKPLAPDARAEKQEKQLRDAAKMYENHFLGQMMKSMRSTIHHDDGFMKQGTGEKIFAEQLDQKYVDGWADKGGVGLADLIYSQIKERYMGTVKKDFSQPTRALPITPQKDPAGMKMPESVKVKMLPVQSQNSLEYRFEVPEPKGEQFAAQAPMSGRVTGLENVGEGWKSVSLDHGLGINSELSFTGDLAQIEVGDDVAAGAPLGKLGGKSPVVAWKLDWDKA